jgi:hypothetical protein
MLLRAKIRWLSQLMVLCRKLCAPDLRGRVEVFGVAGGVVDDAHVALLSQQAGPRAAYLNELEMLPLPVSLCEVAEQRALVVCDEAVLDPSAHPDLAHRVPRPRIVPSLRFEKSGGPGPSDMKNGRDNRSWSPLL